MRVEKRIRALEARMNMDPIILYFGDGTTREIYSRGDSLLDLVLAAWGGGNLSPVQAAQLDLIRRSIDALEPGGGRMIELLQSVLGGAAESPVRD